MIFNTDVLSTAFHKIENIDSTLHCPIISGVKSQYKNRVFIYIYLEILWFGYLVNCTCTGEMMDLIDCT